MDEPDRHAQLAREMGWEHEEEPKPPEYEVPHFEAEEQFRPEAELEADEELAREEAELERMPAYRAAFDAGEHIHRALRPWTEREYPDEDETAELLGRAMIGVHIAAAKIAGGHAMGYEDEVICGNIVNCRRGLAGVIDAETALAELRERGVIPPELADELLPEVRRVKRLVEERIAELRERVWW